MKGGVSRFGKKKGLPWKEPAVANLLKTPSSNIVIRETPGQFIRSIGQMFGSMVPAVPAAVPEDKPAAAAFDAAASPAGRIG